MDPDPERQPSISPAFLFVLFIVFLQACTQSPDQQESKKQPDSRKPNPLHPGSGTTSVSSGFNDTLPVMYLTFDDGPNKGTDKVLDILEAEQVPATFFLIGIQIHGSSRQEKTWARLQQATARGIELQNHSYTHAHNHFARFYLNPAAVVADFKQAADTLHLTANIVRTPGHNVWRTATVNHTDMPSLKAPADSVFQAGYTIMGWDNEWTFNNQLELKKTPEGLLRELDSVTSRNILRTPRNLVLLAHDQSFADSRDSASLHQFIQLVKNSGRYHFGVVSGYPHLKN